MTTSIVFVLRWLFSITKKFIRVVPKYTLNGIAASLLSQIFQVAAFLLPLKVMILLGSPSVPAYFPEPLASIEHRSLIFTLAAASLTFYIAFLLCEQIGSKCAQRGSEVLLEKSSKLVLHEDRDTIARTFYQGFVSSASGFLFALIVVVFLAFTYSALLIFIFLYFVLAILALAALSSSKTKATDIFSKHFPRTINIVFAFAFLLAFSFLVYDFLYWQHPSLIISILSLLLCRQMFSRLATAIKSIDRLYSKKIRINSLFFHSTSLQATHSRDIDFWQIMSPAFCRAWLENLLPDIFTYKEMELTYADSGARGQILLYVTALNDSTKRHFLFKIFSRKNSVVAQHEARLLELKPMKAKAPTLLDISEHEGYFGHLFQWDGNNYAPLPKKELRTCRATVTAELFEWQVPQELISTFTRSKNVLHKRLNEDFWKKCEAVSLWLDPQTFNLVQWFSLAPERLTQPLSALPLCLYNPDIYEGRALTFEGNYLVTFWGGWVLEPLGSGWPIELGLDKLDESFDGASSRNAHLKKIPRQLVRVAALCHAFERLCGRGSYIEAFPLLLEIKALLESLDGQV